MKLDILRTLNTERAARRAAVVVTDVASGEQRLVKAADVARDPLKDAHREAYPQRQERHGGDGAGQGLPHRARSAAAARHHRRGAYQPGAGADRPAARLRRHHRRSAHRLRLDRALSRREGDRRMAGRGAAAARHRPLHGLRGAHPRSQDRRSRAHPCARARLLLYRRARLEEDAWPPPRAPEGAGHHRRRARAHPRADRARHRRGVAARDRGRDHGRDHRAAAQQPWPRRRWRRRHEIRRGAGRRGRGRRSRCIRSARPAWCSRRAP